MRIQSKYLDEKLTAADPTSKWISDFVHSDNPKFEGKSKKERIRMALGAAYSAKGQSRNEETYKDTGWKKPERNPGAKTKNVSGRLARQGMKQAEKETKKVQEENKAYKAQDKESIRTTGMNLNQRSKMYDDIQKKLKDQEEEYRKQGILPPKNEEVELDEGKYGSFRVRSTSGTFGGPKLPRRSYVPQGNQDPRTGLPLGFSPPKETEPKKTKNEQVDEGIGKTIGRIAGQYAGSKLGMEGPGAAGGELLGHHMEYHTREFVKKLHSVIKKHLSGNPSPQNSSFEHDDDSTLISELDEPTLTKFATRARFSSNPKHREAAKQAMEKLKAKKKQETNNEEVEQVDEVLDKPLDVVRHLARRTAKTLKSGLLNPGSGEFTRGKKAIGDVVNRTRKKIENMGEEVELDEDGKLKGGAKDPCWKGYQMVGTKKKGGRTVPNCVPREETELKTFKALREELNGNSNRS